MQADSLSVQIQLVCRGRASVRVPTGNRHFRPELTAGQSDFAADAAGTAYDHNVLARQAKQIFVLAQGHSLLSGRWDARP